MSLDCPIRPTLAFLGVEAESAAGERRREEAEERIFENLQKLSSVNLIQAPREAVNRVLQQEQTTRSALLPESGDEPDLVRRVSDRLAAALEVQGFLAGGAARGAVAARRPGSTSSRREHHRRDDGPSPSSSRRPTSRSSNAWTASSRAGVRGAA